MINIIDMVAIWVKKSEVEKARDIFLFLFFPNFVIIDIMARIEESSVKELTDAILVLITFITIVLNLYTAINKKSFWGGLFSLLLTTGLTFFLIMK